MFSSFRLGRVAGIDLYVHVTFFLLLAWVGYANYAAHRQIADALRGIGFILALFVIVVLHELGHALAARYYGIRTRDITLLPIGGVARLERMPREPKQELVVALAGPAVNVVLAAAFFVGIAVNRQLAPAEEMLTVGAQIVDQLFWINVTLTVFNLLPAFPMDGGRVLRALLAMKLTYVRATQVAARVGQFMAIVFAVLSFFLSPMLLLIALFVWMGAAAEAKVELMRHQIEQQRMGGPIDRPAS
jgi:Zn-dependent protease